MNWIAAVCAFLSVFVCVCGGQPLPSQTDHFSAPQQPRLVIQAGHTAQVSKIIFSRDGLLIATAGSDNQILLWDAKSGAVLQRFASHASIVSIAFNGDASLLAETDLDGTLTLWSLRTGTTSLRRSGITWGLSPVLFSPDDSNLLFGDAKGNLVIWNISSGAPSTLLPADKNGVIAIAISSNGKFISAAGSQGQVTLWDRTSGTAKRVLLGNHSLVQDLAFSPDGSILASGGGVESQSGETCVWNTRQSEPAHCLTEGSERIVYVSFYSNRELVSMEYLQEPEFRDSKSLALLRKAPLFNALPTAAAVSSSSGLIALGDVMGLAWITRFSTMEPLRVLPPTLGAIDNAGNVLGTFGVPKRVLSRGVAVAFTRDNNWMLTATMNGIGLWDRNNGAQVNSFDIPTITGMTVLGDSDTVAIGNYEGTVELLDLNSSLPGRTILRETAPIYSLASDAKQGLIAAADKDGKITVWSESKRTVIASLSTGEQGDSSLAFQPAGAKLIHESQDGTLYIWDISSGGKVLLAKQSSCGFNRPGVAWSPDSTIIAASCGEDVSLWDVSTISPLGVLHGHQGQITSLSFDSQGRTLASTGEDGTVRLWDVKSQALVHSYLSDAPSSDTGNISPDGSWIAAIGGDGVVRIWKTSTEELLFTLLSVTGTKEWLVESPTGLFDGSELAWKVAMWRYGEGVLSMAPLETFFEQLYTPGLLAGSELRVANSSEARFDPRSFSQPVLSLVLKSKDSDDSLPAAVKRTLQQIRDKQINSGNEINDRVINVEIEISEPKNPDSSLHGLRLFRNGLLVKLWRSDIPLDHQGRASVSTSITMQAGDNTLLAYGFNNRGIKSVDSTLKLRGSKNLPQIGVVNILSIGINAYDDPRLHLKYAVDDGQEFAVMIGSEAEKWKAFSEVRVVSLKDSDATKTNIQAALRRLSGAQDSLPEGAPASVAKFAKMAPEDILFIYFAGHGHSDGDRFYMVPQDTGYDGNDEQAELKRVKQIEFHSISDLELEDALEPIDARQIVLILDACSSGQVLESKEARMGPMNVFGLGHLAYEKGMYILAAAQPHRAALELSRFGHGMLTYALLQEGLKDSKAADADGIVSLRGWLEFAAVEVRRLQNGELDSENKKRALIVEGESWQSPRVFYRREAGAQFVIKTLNGASIKIEDRVSTAR